MPIALLTDCRQFDILPVVPGRSFAGIGEARRRTGLYWEAPSHFMIVSAGAPCFISTLDQLIAIVLVTEGLLLTPVRAQQSVIEVSYLEVQNAISPKAGIFRVPRTTQIRLTGENTLAVTGRSQYGAGGTRTSSREVRAGENVQSGVASSRWRVGGSNTLIRETSLPRHVVRTTIRISGNACKADVSFHLKRGATQFQMPWAPTGEPAFFRAIHAEKVTCRIVGG